MIEKKGNGHVVVHLDTTALVAALEDARAVLRRVEWAGTGPDGRPCCPECGSHEHRPDCALARVLGP